MEMCTYAHLYFINNDLEMHHDDSDTPAKARSSIVTDLGQIQYVFSDKTGTLTQNVMRFKRASIQGKVYGAPVLMTEANATLPYINIQGLNPDAQPGSQADDFLKVLALCHTVVIESDAMSSEGNTKGSGAALIYQAESPDEKALVEFAREAGYELIGRTTSQITIKINGTTQFWTALAVNKFDSDRKRMSIVVRDAEGRVRLLCKGADTAMLPRGSCGSVEEAATVVDHLKTFAQEGLRTLVLGYRDLTAAQYTEWLASYREASAAAKDRADLMSKVADNLEKDMIIVGLTAIEDKLQDGVPDTIADLAKGGIKFCVLTGDKMETAINIGYSCRLLGSRMALLKLKDTGDPATIRRHLKKLLNAFDWLVEHERKLGDSLGRRIMERMTQCTRKGPMGFRSSWQVGEEEIKIMEDPDLKVCYQPQNDAPHFKQLTSDTVALVVDGPALVHIFGDPEYEAMFLRLTSVCRSVVACRVSPAQKRMIVRLVKSGITPKPITLSIGDGANDVAMIQEAQIGVGISGKEGKQAVNSADFAIAQFRFLKRLLLIHGRYDYRRMSKVILYSFYKNIVLTFILFYYLFFSGFSGQSLFSDLVYSAFNFLCAMPIIWYVFVRACSICFLLLQILAHYFS
jgi:phospholipid-translocating P-type ATPase (flippase)